MSPRRMKSLATGVFPRRRNARSGLCLEHSSLSYFPRRLPRHGGREGLDDRLAAEELVMDLDPLDPLSGERRLLPGEFIQGQVRWPPWKFFRNSGKACGPM